MWSRQQRWEVQKAALLDTLKELASAEAAVWAFVWTFSRKDHDTEEGKQDRKEANEKYTNAINAFWRTKLATSIVCGREIADQLEKLDNLFGRVRIRTGEGQFGMIWDTLYSEIVAEKRKLR